MRNSLFAATEWITRFAYVNLLWIGFTLIGLVFFGIFPATVAMFTILRQWMMKNEDVAVFSTFWTTYKKEFFKSNLFGLCFYLIGFVFFINLQFLAINQGDFLDFLKIPVYIFMLIISLTLLYIIPTYVHYELRFLDVWKNAFLIMMIHPFHNIAMVIGSIVILYIMWQFPGSLLFFGASTVGFIIMGTCYHTFQRVAKKKEQKEAGT